MTRIGASVDGLTRDHPGLSGIHPLANPHDAFAARMLGAAAAENSLDVQYYIWRRDMTGTLLLEALHGAADRGVRVRLLLDDYGVSGLDGELAALDSHPNIRVRLFNPFFTRRPKWLGFLTDFRRANRRMHNKVFIVDGRAAIVGGRNIGDEYFGAADGVLFADLDALCVGPVVGDVSGDFDRYWNSASAYSVRDVLPAAGTDRLAMLAKACGRVERNPAAAGYVEAVRRSHFMGDLSAGTLDLEWAPVRMVSDDPAKGLARAGREGHLVHQLGEIIGEPERDVELVSPYFVPTAAGAESFAELARRGIRVRIFTNSLEATDVAAVHAGYAKRRGTLLDAGVALYEMRRKPPEPVRGRGSGLFAGSAGSLHAKTFAVDGRRVFIGSFNFDPRSANLNTELGFVIESPHLARRIEETFDTEIPANSYRVRRDGKGRMSWLETRDGKTIRRDREPGAGIARRFLVFVLSHLPIEPLL